MSVLPEKFNKKYTEPCEELSMYLMYNAAINDTHTAISKALEDELGVEAILSLLNKYAHMNSVDIKDNRIATKLHAHIKQVLLGEGNDE